MKLLQKFINKTQTFIGKIVKSCYENYMRKRLKNTDFTILCSNCIGGIIYNRLGLQFRTPTVNLWMYQRDFIRFAANIRIYQHLPLQFIETDYGYPVATLGEITIFFNHSNSCEEASADWYRRIKRINHDNLFLIMYECEDITEEDIRSLENIPCKGKLVLSNKKHPDIAYVKTMKPGKHLYGNQCIDRDWFGFRTFEKHFDYVKWLNS